MNESSDSIEVLSLRFAAFAERQKATVVGRKRGGLENTRAKTDFWMRMF